MTRKYKVAGTGFHISLADESPLWGGLLNYKPFEVADCEAVFKLEIGVEIDICGKVPYYVETPEKGMPLIEVFRVGDDWLFEMSPVSTIEKCVWMRCNSDFSKASLYYDKYGLFAVNNALMILFSCCTAGRDTLEMHSSVVTKDGLGYMFLGKSGTGKSTHSSLWMKNIPGAVLLNDDNPVIHITDSGEIRVYGSPWSGKTPCYRNMDVPIGAIVRIEQAPYNKIHRLPVIEAYASIISSTSAFRPVEKIADAVHLTIEKVVSSIPCYTLQCLPDNEAALVCFSEVTR